MLRKNIESLESSSVVWINKEYTWNIINLWIEKLQIDESIFHSNYVWSWSWTKYSEFSIFNFFNQWKNSGLRKN